MALLLTQTSSFGAITYSRPRSPLYPATLGFVGNPILTPAVQAPFAQYDWPVPRAARPAGFDWIRSTPVQLIGKDTVYGAPGQVPTYDIPGQPAARRNPADWIWSQPINLTGQKPFAQYDWPLAKVTPPKARDWIWSTQIQLIGQDTVYGAPGQAPTYDLSGPKLRTPIPGGWIQIPPPVTVAAAPFAQYDWPQPKVRVQAARDWIWSTPLNLVGQDTFFMPGAINFSPPSLYVRTLSPPGFINPGITVVVTQNPFFQTDWPLPQRPRYPTGFGSWVDFDSFLIATNQPFAQTDWPQPIRLPDRRPDWIRSTQIQLIGQDTVYGAPGQVPSYDLSPPKLRPYATTLNGWLNPGITTVVVQTPFFQTDWPQPPRGRVPGKDWIWSTPIQLIGQDRVYGAPGQVPTYDLSPPKIRPFSTSLNGFLQNGITIAQFAGPFNQTDWPQPPRRAVAGRDWIWPTPVNLIGKDKVYGAPGQVPTYDIPLAPRGRVLPPPGFINFATPPSIIPAGFTQSGNRPLLTLPIYPVFWKGRSSGQFILDQSDLDSDDTLV